MARNKFSVVIPAFNEEKNLARVLRIVTQSPKVNQVIVVNDGSTDKTNDIVKKFDRKITLISYAKNKGMGYALKRGLEKASSDWVAFLDADLVGLKLRHLKLLQATALKYPQSHIIGVVQNASQAAGAKLAMLPGGIRIFKKSLLTEKFIAQWPKYNYAIDLMITDYFKAQGFPIFFLQLPGLNHSKKIQKWGWRKGIEKEIKMYYHFIKTIPKLKSGVKLVRNNLVING
jgi:glycosyltransferase involved in cell wall biosynthesis